MSAAGLSALVSLTSLGLHRATCCKLPSLAALTALKHLVHSNCWRFDPTALAGLSGLQHLDLGGLICNIHSQEQDAVALMSLLQQLTQLSSLSLDGAELPEPAAAAKCAAYSAITSSTGLKQLRLKGFVPASAWPHVFSASQQLPQLSMLEVGYNYGTNTAPFSNQPWQKMVQACPALQHLKLHLGAKPKHGAGRVHAQSYCRSHS